MRRIAIGLCILATGCLFPAGPEVDEGKIDGLVIGSEPIRDAAIVLRKWDPEHQLWLRANETISDQNGRFEFNLGAQRGSFWVTAAGGMTSEYWAEEDVEFDADQILQTVIVEHVPGETKPVVVEFFDGRRVSGQVVMNDEGLRISGGDEELLVQSSEVFALDEANTKVLDGLEANTDLGMNIVRGNNQVTQISFGGGIGYVLGNEQDKQKASSMSRQSEARGYTHSETGTLAGTRWNLVDLNPSDIVPPYVSKVIEFRPDGRVVTTTTNPNGSIDTSNETYRVVGDTLIVNKPGYLINARYGVTGDQLVLSAEKFSAVLQRM